MTRADPALTRAMYRWGAVAVIQDGRCRTKAIALPDDRLGWRSQAPPLPAEAPPPDVLTVDTIASAVETFERESTARPWLSGAKLREIVDAYRWPRREPPDAG